MSSANLRVHALLHVPFEGLGQIRPWLQKQGFTLTETHLYQQAMLPAVSDFDWLIVMGGPMSVSDTQEHTWLASEKALLQAAIKADKTLLGICLGAQLIAEVAGGEVVAGEPEIGWWPLSVDTAVTDDRFGFDKLKAFHWHGEQFKLPPKAIRLASSQCCPNQAFQLGERIIGLQFHLETTATSAQLLTENAAEDMIPANYVQDADTLLDAGPADYQALRHSLEKILSYLAGCCVPAPSATR